MNEQLRKLLQAGTVHFAYRKKTGELRIAAGTTKLDLIPDAAHPKGTGAEKSHTQAYWDLKVEGWRAFNPDQVVWVKDYFQADLTQDEADAISDYLVNFD